jgi:hypothetical protein
MISFRETPMNVELTMQWAIRGMRLAESMSTPMTPTTYSPINVAVRMRRAGQYQQRSPEVAPKHEVHRGGKRDAI